MRTGLDYKTAFLFLYIFFYNANSTAEELRDPTKPAYFISSVSQIDSQQTDSLNLSSIWVSGHSKRATINGIVAKQGDVILSDIKILRIYKNMVKIEQNGITKKLSILTHNYKTK